MSPLPLLAIVLAYLLLGALYALRTPAWQAPDEPAHYNYIAQLANGGCCPVIAEGDWDSAYLDQLKANDFAPTLLADLPTIQYEDHQPPLYYLLLSPIFSVTGGSLVALRLATVFIGLTVVLYAYILTWLVLPRRPGAALAAAAFVAFLPQLLGITASVNNDALSWSLIGLTLIGVVTYLRSEARDLGTEVVLGVLVGLALLTKVNTIFLLGVVSAAIVMKALRPKDLAQHDAGLARRTRHASSRLVRLAAFLLPALILVGVWWVRNLATYGAPDFLGLAAHDRVVVGQLRTDALIAELGAGAYLSRALMTTYNSFFGQLGWMALPLPAWVYYALGALMIAALAGWVLRWRSRRHGGSSVDKKRIERETAIILGLVLALAVAQFIYYNTEFVQFQGRYLYTGLVPFTLLVGGGLDRLMAWLMERGGARDSDSRGNGGRGTPHPYGSVGDVGTSNGASISDYIAVGVIALLIPLNLWLLWRVIPGLAP
jgi:4-amino-4-deoxy-L-arabinose transferase-like glycosyltransferase